jgi:hypothetical protein
VYRFIIPRFQLQCNKIRGERGSTPRTGDSFAFRINFFRFLFIAFLVFSFDCDTLTRSRRDVAEALAMSKTWWVC